MHNQCFDCSITNAGLQSASDLRQIKKRPDVDRRWRLQPCYVPRAFLMLQLRFASSVKAGLLNIYRDWHSRHEAVEQDFLIEALQVTGTVLGTKGGKKDSLFGLQSNPVKRSPGWLTAETTRLHTARGHSRLVTQHCATSTLCSKVLAQAIQMCSKQ
jgi:hypothetical protein